MWKLVILLLAISLGPALAQGEAGQKPVPVDGQTQGKAKPAKGDKKSAAENQEPAKSDDTSAADAQAERAKAARIKTPPVAIELGASDWNLSGNDHKFRQYATPARGLFLGEFLLAPRVSLRNTGYLDLRGLGQLAYREDGRIALNHGWTQADVAFWHNTFFDPTPLIVNDSDRNAQEESFKQLLTRDASLSFRYKMDGQDQYFEPPRLPLHQRTRYWDTIGAGRLGPGMLKLEYTDWRYFDRTGTIFDTVVQGWRASYMWQPGGNTGVEANVSGHDIKQPSRPTAHAVTQSLSADTTVGDATDLSVALRHDHLNQNQAQSAYARDQRSGTFGVAHRFFNNWTAKLSFQQREVERVRADQSFVDVPRWDTFEGSLYGRVAKLFRLTARGYTQNASNLPPMVTDDPRSLYWNHRQFAQVKLERGNQDLSSYFVWSYRNWDNDARNVHLNFNSFVAGGSWQATPDVTLFAEYTKENWNGNSEITEFPTFQNFLPDSHIITAGLNWVMNPRAFFALNVTTFGTNNDNPLLLRDGNTNGMFFTLNARYEFPSGSEVGFVIAPWDYRDVVLGSMNYDATVVMFTGKARF